MKICFVGGAQSIHINRWVKWFAKHGHDVHLISVDTTKIDGVKVHKIGDERKRGGLLNYIRKLVQTRKLVREIQPDILHAHYVFGYGTFAAFANFHPFILSAWGSYIAIDPDKSKINFKLTKYTIKKADLIHTWDEFGKKRLKSLGANEKKIFLLYHGLDTNNFSPKAFSKDLRKKFDQNNTKIIISARPLTNKYNVELIIEAASYVIKESKNIKFVIIGDGALRKKLEKRCQNLGIFSYFNFVGKIPYKEMPRYLATADLFVDTSSDFRKNGYINKGGSGIGLTNLEAMSCGATTILPDRISIIESEYNGIIYKQLDIGDLAKKIIMGLNNIEGDLRDFVLKKADLEKNMKIWEKIYGDMEIK